jgi:PBP1b-binding outer membrane lipoprotein LpoB
MKKFLAIAAIAVAFASCEEKKAENADAPKTDTTAATAPTDTTAPKPADTTAITAPTTATPVDAAKDAAGKMVDGAKDAAKDAAGKMVDGAKDAIKK